jgi:hypothetical protein
VATFPENLLNVKGNIITKKNKLHLAEIECLSPDLCFNLSQNALEKFVAAIVELIA